MTVADPQRTRTGDWYGRQIRIAYRTHHLGLSAAIGCGYDYWSRYLFGASMVIGMGAMLLAELLSEWWGPVSILVMVLAASAFLICSVLEYRRGRATVDTSKQQLAP